MTNPETGPDGEVHIEKEEARAGETSGHMRWVLGVGLVLAIVAMSIIWVIPALSGAAN